MKYLCGEDLDLVRRRTVMPFKRSLGMKKRPTSGNLPESLGNSRQPGFAPAGASGWFMMEQGLQRGFPEMKSGSDSPETSPKIPFLPLNKVRK